VGLEGGVYREDAKGGKGDIVSGWASQAVGRGMAVAWKAEGSTKAHEGAVAAVGDWVD